jgi:hypothetical protein
MPFKRSNDFSHFVQKILLYPNSEQTSAKPAALRVVHCSTSGFFSLRSKDPSLSECRTNQRKACQRFALLSFFMPTPL